MIECAQYTITKLVVRPDLQQYHSFHLDVEDEGVVFYEQLKVRKTLFLVHFNKLLLNNSADYIKSPLSPAIPLKSARSISKTLTTPNYKEIKIWSKLTTVLTFWGTTFTTLTVSKVRLWGVKTHLMLVSR